MNYRFVFDWSDGWDLNWLCVYIAILRSQLEKLASLIVHLYFKNSLSQSHCENCFCLGAWMSPFLFLNPISFIFVVEKYLFL